MIPPLDLRNQWTKVHRTFSLNVGGFAVNEVHIRFWISSSFWRYSLLKFEFVWNWDKFCTFLVPKIFSRRALQIFGASF